MCFSGIRYRRVRWDDIDNLVDCTDANKTTRCILKNKCYAPIFSYRRINEKLIQFSMECNGKMYDSYFTLGEVTEIKKPDGTKIKTRYTLEGDNVLNQDIIMPRGKVSRFRREFGEDGAKMTVTVNGSPDVKATIYYEVVK